MTRSRPGREYRLAGRFTRKSFQLLAHAYRTERLFFTLAISAAALFGLLTAAFGTMLGALTDDIVVPALTGGTMKGFWGGASTDPRIAILVAGGVFAGIGIVNAVLVGARRTLQGWAVAGVGAHHRKVVADALASLPLGWHRANPSGRMLSAMSSDSETATSPLYPFAFTVGSFVMMAAAGVAMWLMDPWLALTGLAVIPAILAINLAYEKVITPRWDLGQSLRAEVSTIAHESFDGATVVKALGAEDRETARFAVASRALRDADTRVGRTSAWFEPMMDAVVPLGSVALMIVGAHRAQAGAVSVGDVVSSIYLLTLLAVPIRGIGWVLGQMPQGLVAFRRVGEIAEAATEIDEPGHLEIAQVGAGEVRMEGADIAADDGGAQPTVLVHGVDLALQPGTVTALVGSTGAGKSTVALAAVRLARPSSGMVRLDGVDLNHVAQLGLHIALVPQASFVFADTVRENVTLGDDFTDEEVWDALKRAQMDDVVRTLSGAAGSGLDAELHERGMNLSGGQRQRLALARALVRGPRVLVLDDATSAVDPKVEGRILRGLKGASDSPTILLVAYRLSSILLADRVIHVDRGRVVDVGTHDELMARDAGYKDLVFAYEAESRRQAQERAGWIG